MCGQVKTTLLLLILRQTDIPLHRLVGIDVPQQRLPAGTGSVKPPATPRAELRKTARTRSSSSSGESRPPSRDLLVKAHRLHIRCLM